MSEVLQFQCHQCQDTFHSRVTLTDHPSVILECPYCGAKCFVNFNPYGEQIVIILRNGGTLAASGKSLPEVIPTQKPE